MNAGGDRRILFKKTNKQTNKQRLHQTNKSVMSANAGVITANGDFVPINNKKRKQVAEENFLKRQAEEQAKKQQEAQAKALAEDAARARADAEAARLAQVLVHPSRDLLRFEFPTM